MSPAHIASIHDEFCPLHPGAFLFQALALLSTASAARAGSAPGRPLDPWEWGSQPWLRIATSTYQKTKPTNQSTNDPKHKHHELQTFFGLRSLPCKSLSMPSTCVANQLFNPKGSRLPTLVGSMRISTNPTDDLQLDHGVVSGW